MNGKIIRLPKSIRDQLNQRLADDQPKHLILRWLNSLPEVQALTAADPQKLPITKQNLHAWCQHGFRNWQLRQDALQFAADDEPDPADAAPDPLFLQKLVHWLSLRYAALANTLSPDPADPDAELRLLRNLAADVIALRRGDLYASRIAIEEQRLSMLQTQADEDREAEFWEWAKQPEIWLQLKLKYLKDKFWSDRIRAAVPKLAPQLDALDAFERDLNPRHPDETADPAILI